MLLRRGGFPSQTPAQERFSTLRRIVRDAIDLIYPPLCVVCDCDARSGSPLCDACLADLAEASRQRPCIACGRPVGEGEDQRQRGPACPWCHGRGVGRIKRVARLGMMASPLREVIHHVKFHGRWELAGWLGTMLAREAAVLSICGDADAIVPVPLHPFRKAHRGYNQAMLIARRLARVSHLPVIQPAVRARATVAQTSLSSVVARQKNLREAFVLLEPQLVENRRLVLVDDVMTTGATLRSLAHCLWPARPAALSAVVAAVADPKSKAFDVV